MEKRPSDILFVKISRRNVEVVTCLSPRAQAPHLPALPQLLGTHAPCSQPGARGKWRPLRTPQGPGNDGANAAWPAAAAWHRPRSYLNPRPRGKRGLLFHMRLRATSTKPHSSLAMGGFTLLFLKALERSNLGGRVAGWMSFQSCRGQRPCPGSAPKATVKPECHNTARSASRRSEDRSRTTRPGPRRLSSVSRGVHASPGAPSLCRRAGGSAAEPACGGRSAPGAC